MSEQFEMPSEPRLTEHDISDDDTLLFLHIPKSAGTTLGIQIDPMWLPHKRSPIYLMRELKDASRSDFERARSFIGHFFLDGVASILNRPLVTITVLREPISRYISAFYQVRREPPRAAARMHEDWGRMRAMSLVEFVEYQTLNRREATANQQTRRIAAPFPIRELDDIPRLTKQLNTDPPRIAIADAYRKLAGLEFFGLTERFQESLWLLCFVFGWYPIENRLAANRAPKPTETRSVAPEILAQIVAMNDQDLELYASAGQLFEERYTRLMETLRERYGTRQHAHETLPLSHESMRELLTKHFQARHLARNPGGSGHAVRFSFLENAETAQGWHGLENSPRWGAYRWTGPGTDSSLILPRPADRALRLQFSVLHVPKAEQLDRLSVSANRVPVSVTRTVNPEGLSIYEGVIPHAAVRDSTYVHLEWHLTETLRPIDVEENNDDVRELGLAISWVELEPLTVPLTNNLAAALAPAE